MKVLEDFSQCLEEKQYAPSTINSYLNCLRNFLQHLSKPSAQITCKDIEYYIQQKIETDSIAASTQKQLIRAIKLFYKELYQRDLATLSCISNRKNTPLPIILPKQQVIAIIQAPNNLKHQTLLTTIYSAGLRVSEVIQLKVSDVQPKKMQINLAATPRFPKRAIPLSKTLLTLLEAYYKAYKPKKWLFEGQGGKPYARTSIQKVFKQALTKAKIEEKVTLHTLRHSLAVHLLEQGLDVKLVQELLGHYSQKSTQLYARLMAAQEVVIRHPLDG